MALKIDNIPTSNAVAGRRNQTGKEVPSEIASEGKTENLATSGDRVTLTKGANHLVSLVKSTNDLHEASAERIEKLKNSISDGSYKINSQLIADKLRQIESRL